MLCVTEKHYSLSTADNNFDQDHSEEIAESFSRDGQFNWLYSYFHPSPKHPHNVHGNIISGEMGTISKNNLTTIIRPMVD